MEEEILKMMTTWEFEDECKILVEEYKYAPPLRKYHIWYQLYKYGINILK